MGRTRRLVLLFTVIAGVVIALMILATRPAGAVDGTVETANQPQLASAPCFHQRIEALEAGRIAARS